MKITQVRAFPFALPLEEPLKWATGSMSSAEHVLIRIMTSEGIEGYGEAVPRTTIYGETQKSIVEIVNNVMGPQLVGLDPLDREQIWGRMSPIIWNPTAKGAIDVALYDIIGKHFGVPVYRLLGGWSNKVPLSWMVGLKPISGMLEEVEAKLRLGIKSFKLKGGIDPKKDIDVVRAVRERFGPEVRLYLDANQGYDVASAILVAREVGHEMACIEEPLPVWDSWGRKKVAQSITLPILADESVFTVNDVLTQLEMGVIGQLSIKIPRTGFTHSKKIVHLCEAFNIPIQMGTQGETTLGTMAAAHFAAAHRQVSLPSEISYYLAIKDSIINEEITLEEGSIVVPDRPGLGVSVNEEKLSRYTSF